MKESFKRYLWMGLALAALGAPGPACSNEKKMKGGGGGSGSKEDIKVLEENRNVEGIDSYQGVRGSGFVVKNYLQLHAAADACLGAGLGTIAEDMFAPGRCGAGSGKKPMAAAADPAAPAATDDTLVILGADKCAFRGQHVYDVLKDQLWSPDLAGRTDTLANQLTPAYLQALAVAADVYSHGVVDPGAQCDTKEKTKELLMKCIAQFDEATVEKAVDTVHGLCSQGGVKAREAIATILGSAAFAAAAPKDGQ